jgi:hypothetical protein
MREDLVHLSELHGLLRTYVNWWLQCRARKPWTIAIHKLKQTNKKCRKGAVRAAVHQVWSVKCLIINRFGGAGETDGRYRLGGGIARRCQGMCSLARVSTAVGVKHLITQFGLTFKSTCVGYDFQVYMCGLGSSYPNVVEMHT